MDSDRDVVLVLYLMYSTDDNFSYLFHSYLETFLGVNVDKSQIMEKLLFI